MEAPASNPHWMTSPILRWEFNSLLIEGIVAGAGLAVLLVECGRLLLRHGVPVPLSMWTALGFFAVGVTQFPALSLHVRAAKGRQLRFRSFLAGCILASIIGWAFLHFGFGVR